MSHSTPPPAHPPRAPARHAWRAWCLTLGLLLCAGAARAEPLWFVGGLPSADAREAVALLAAAAEDGLDPRDYDADALSAALAVAERAPAGPDSIARLDTALSESMRRYFQHLRHGRVDPRRLGEQFDAVPADPFDADAYLRDALAKHRLRDAAREAAPPLPEYAGLRRALAHYRTLAADPARTAAWQHPLPPLPGRKLEPGQAWSGLGAAMARLEILGDLPTGTPVPAHLEGVATEAIRAFQARHGLADDGVIGKGTLEQLEITPAARVRQIELAMERLRWTPWARVPRMIVVNVPEFMLRAYDGPPGGSGKPAPRLEMKVIVGRAAATRTPLFAEDMRYIEFSPYWNVPPSIARGETVPRLRQDPAYFEQQGFEFVGHDGSVSTALTPEHLDATARGQLRIRQRPGPRNALGDIKFVFPNHDNIYLHHTPSPGLFARDRRDFSHGCVRVEQPAELAGFVLSGDPDWPRERIQAAMDKGTSATLRLREPLPVVIAYVTALVRQDGLVYFFRDIYGRDAALEQALRRAPREDTSVATR